MTNKSASKSARKQVKIKDLPATKTKLTGDQMKKVQGGSSQPPVEATQKAAQDEENRRR